MDTFSHLETKRLILRRFEDADLPFFMTYRNDPLVAQYQGWDGITDEDARAFIARQKVQEFGVPGQGLQIAIERKDTGQLIGDCLLRVDPEEQRQASLGFTLARDYQGYGFATEAVCCLLDFAFATLELHRIVAITGSENVASVALLERLQFRREGELRQSYWNKGRWTDEYLYAMLKAEWLHPRARGAVRQ